MGSLFGGTGINRFKEFYVRILNLNCIFVLLKGDLLEFHCKLRVKFLVELVELGQSFRSVGLVFVY